MVLFYQKTLYWLSYTGTWDRCPAAFVNCQVISGTDEQSDRYCGSQMFKHIMLLRKAALHV